MSEFEKELEKNMKSGKVAHERESLYSDFLVSKRDIERIFEDWQPPKELVEVPQIVADWFEDNKENLEDATWEYIRDWSEQRCDAFYNWFNEDYRPIETLIRMGLEGYTVKKEKLYYIKIKKTGASYLNLRIDTGGIVFADNEDYNIYKTKFTEQEIKDIDERYWPFAVPAGEVEG